MKAAYETPQAMVAWFMARDLLMASGESDSGITDGTGGDGFWSEDGVIHLPPVPLN